MISQQPKEITLCLLEVVVMPNGEIISLGKTIGFFKEYKNYLTVRPPDPRAAAWGQTESQVK